MEERWGIFSVWLEIARNARLILEMAKLEVSKSTKGMLLGVSWVVLQPFIYVLIYSFILSYVLRIRVPGADGGFGFAVFVLQGMVPWLFIARVIDEAPSMIRSRTELLKQVVYPIEILPISRILFHAIGFFSGLIVLFALALFFDKITLSWLLLPIPLLLLVQFLISVSWILMLVGVVLKDLQAVISTFLGFLIFVSPVLYDLDAIPENVRTVIYFNPFSHFIIMFRDIFEGQFTPASWVFVLILNAVVAGAGSFLIGRFKQIVRELV